MEDQVVILYTAINGYLMDIETRRVGAFNQGLLQYIHSSDQALMDSILEVGQLTPEIEAKLKADIEAFMKDWNA